MKNTMATAIMTSHVPGMHPDAAAKAASLKRSNNDMRERINVLKATIQEEKFRADEIHREKVQELRTVRNIAEMEKAKELDTLKAKMLDEKAREIKELTDKLQMEKEREMSEFMRRRDREEADRRHRWEMELEESERSLSRRIRTETAQDLSDRMGRDLEDLRRMNDELLDQKEKLERLYMHKCESDQAKAEEIRRMHEDHDREKQRLMREGRLEMQKELNLRRDREATINRLEKELSRANRKCSIFEAEKNKLQDDVLTMKTADSWSRRTGTPRGPSIGTPVGTPRAHPRTPSTYTPTSTARERTALQKKVESDRALRELNNKLTALQKENRALKQQAQQAAHREVPQGDRVDQLTKQNSSLSSQTMRLNSKVKFLDSELSSVKSDLSQARNELAKTKTALSKAREDSARRPKRTTAPSDNTMVLKHNLKVASDKQRELESEIDQQNRAVEKLKRDLKQARSQLKQAQAASQASATSTTNEDAGKLASIVKEKDAAINTLNTELTKLQQKFSAFRNKKAATPTPAPAGPSKLQQSVQKQMEAEREANQRQLVDLEGSLRLANADLRKTQAANEKVVADKDREIANLKLKIEGLQKEIKTASSSSSPAKTSKPTTATTTTTTPAKEQAKPAPMEPQDSTEALVDKLAQAAQEAARNAQKQRQAPIQATSRPDSVNKARNLAKQQGQVSELEVEAKKKAKTAEVAAAKEAKRKEEEAKKKEREDAKKEAARKREEAARIKKEQEDAKKKEAEAKKAEAARVKKEQEEAKKAEAARVKKEQEEAKKAEAARVKKEQEAEAKRKAEEAKAAEELRKVEDAKKAEQLKSKAMQAKEEARKKREAAQAAKKKEADAAEELRQRALADKKAQEDEAARKAEEAKLAAEQKRQELEEMRLQEEAKAAEAKRLEEEAKRKAEEAKAAAEAKRLEAEAKQKAEEERKAEELRIAKEKAEEVKRLEEEARRAEEERLQAEHEAKLAEEQRQAEEEARLEDERRAAEEAEAERLRLEEEERNNAQEVVQLCRCLYSYNPEEGPNEDDEELAFEEGDILRLYGEQDEDGFYMGEHTEGPNAGKRGFVPFNHIELLEEGEENQIRDQDDAMAGGNTAAPVDDEIYVVALYDYDPETQSPNDDPDEELPLVEGMRLLLVGEEEPDEDGFYRCMNLETNEEGLVPSNFVQFEDPGAEEVDSYPVGTIVVGLHDYDPQVLSPNDELDEELPFAEGDRMVIVAEMDEDGFYQAEHKITGQRGAIPRNFITVDNDDITIDITNKSGYTSLQNKLAAR